MDSMLLSVILFSLVSTVFWFCFLVWVSVATGERGRDIALPSLKSLMISSACISPVVLVLGLGLEVLSPISAALLSAVLFFSYYGWLIRRAYK